ncbi:hypothetical protein ACVIGB_000649 [Bradyrhizobium sp. USDA 4341]
MLPTQSITFRRDRFGLERTVCLPVLDGACETVARWTSWGAEFPIIHADNRFYRVARRYSDDGERPALALQHLSERAELSEVDIDLARDRLALHKGRLMAAIAKPVWLLRVEDTGNRMHIRENARQGITVRFSADFGSDFWRSIDPLTTSQAPTVAFSLRRRAEAEVLVQPLAGEIPYGDIQSSTDRVEVLRPDLFEVDDVAVSTRLMGQMIIALGHAAAPALSRAAIDEWLALRILFGAQTAADTAELAAIWRHTTAFLDHLRITETSAPELNTVLKRARNACTLLVHRAAADLSPKLRASSGADLDVNAIELAAATI